MCCIGMNYLCRLHHCPGMQAGRANERWEKTAATPAGHVASIDVDLGGLGG
jgi:hypothetical protein